MREYLSIGFTVFTSFLISFVVGFFLYPVLDGLRISLYCPVEVREGQCYVSGWKLISHTVCSIVSGVMAMTSISVTALFQSQRRLIATKATFITGLMLAIPFSLLIMSAWAYIAALTFGLLAYLLVKRLTRDYGSKSTKPSK